MPELSPPSVSTVSLTIALVTLVLFGVRFLRARNRMGLVGLGLAPVAVALALALSLGSHQLAHYVTFMHEGTTGRIIESTFAYSHSGPRFRELLRDFACWNEPSVLTTMRLNLFLEGVVVGSALVALLLAVDSVLVAAFCGVFVFCTPVLVLPTLSETSSLLCLHLLKER